VEDCAGVGRFFSAPQGLFDLAATLGAPTSLSAIGMNESDLDKAAEIATAEPVLQPSPRHS